MTLRLSDFVAIVHGLYPPALAEDWDRVGLVAGDPHDPVVKIALTVDPVRDTVDEALAWGADLLVTHHPLLLRGVHSVAADTFKGALVHRLIKGGCGLLCAHTNADAALDGVADALAEAIGVTDTRPLVPNDDEVTGIGRVGRLERPMLLGDFARQVASSIPATAQGVRVAGDTAARIETVAVLGGSGDSLFDEVRGSGADAYVTADLRHHPASEARERAEFDGGGRPYLVDVSHSASEWPWLERVASRLRSEAAARGALVETRVSTINTDPWTARFA